MPRNEATDVFLVGGIPTPLKNFSQMGLLFPIRGKIKKCSKPPTSFFWDLDGFGHPNVQQK